MHRLICDGVTLTPPDGDPIPCSMGRTGLISAGNKREGDGATPIGTWRITQGYYRPDRIERPACALQLTALTPQSGWCDDPADPAYNRFVTLPHAASHEEMWRDDGLYDLIFVTDHNATPPVPGMGSAIFLHCRNPRGKPTAGCIAIARDSLIALARTFTQETVLEIAPAHRS